MVLSLSCEQWICPQNPIFTSSAVLSPHLLAILLACAKSFLRCRVIAQCEWCGVWRLLALLVDQITHMKLETKIRNLITEANHDADARFNVVAFELWGNSREGFDTNTAWYIANNADLSQVLEAARGRWEVFKVNYVPKARVSDISDSGYDSNLSLEVDSVPFLEIRLA